MAAPPTPEWWLCSNGQCDHGSILHDIEEMDDPSPTCCVEGCGCGRPDVEAVRESEDDW